MSVGDLIKNLILLLKLSLRNGRTHCRYRHICNSWSMELRNPFSGMGDAEFASEMEATFRCIVDRCNAMLWLRWPRMGR